jgi:hypothetical protein
MSPGSPMIEGFEGRGFMPGGLGDPRYAGIPRPLVERLLRSWFVWLQDRARIHVRPADSPVEAELQIRRWKTKPDLVTFRWRNSTPTRHVFEPVRAAFAVERPDAVVELTSKARRPRAITMATSADDVLAPAWAMGPVVSAFRHCGIPSIACFDMSTMAHVRSGLTTEGPLEPRAKAWDSWLQGREGCRPHPQTVRVSHVSGRSLCDAGCAS